MCMLIFKEKPRVQHDFWVPELLSVGGVQSVGLQVTACVSKLQEKCWGIVPFEQEVEIILRSSWEELNFHWGD